MKERAYSHFWVLLMLGVYLNFVHMTEHACLDDVVDPGERKDAIRFKRMLKFFLREDWRKEFPLLCVEVFDFQAVPDLVEAFPIPPFGYLIEWKRESPIRVSFTGRCVLRDREARVVEISGPEEFHSYQELFSASSAAACDCEDFLCLIMDEFKKILVWCLCNFFLVVVVQLVRNGILGNKALNAPLREEFCTEVEGIVNELFVDLIT